MLKNLKNKVVQFKLQYQNFPAPYGGGITSNTQCLKKFNLNPRIKNNSEEISTYFEIEASKNFLYGKCDGEKVEFYSRYFMITCKKNGQSFDVKFFSKNKEALRDFEVQCIR